MLWLWLTGNTFVLTCIYFCSFNLWLSKDTQFCLVVCSQLQLLCLPPEKAEQWCGLTSTLWSRSSESGLEASVR